MLGAGRWVLGTGHWVLGTGYCVLALGTGSWALNMANMASPMICCKGLRDTQIPKLQYGRGKHHHFYRLRRQFLNI